MASQFTILVPVTNSRASLEAVAAGATVAKARRGKLIAIHVIEVARHLPLTERMEADARRGDQVLRKAEDAARESGVQAAAELLQARMAGQAIIDEVQDKEIDVVVLGIPHKRDFGGFQLGSTAEFVLRNAPCEVWIVRESAVPAHAHTENHEAQRR